MTDFPKKFISLETNFILDLYYGFGIKSKIVSIFNPNFFQIGGTNKNFIEEYHDFIDYGGLYKFRVSINEKYMDDPTKVWIGVLTKKKEECATIVIDKDTKTAILHNMSLFEDCSQKITRSVDGLMKSIKPQSGLAQGGIADGSKLLRFTLNLLLRYKEKYGFDKILLKDNSFLYCQSCSKTVKLASLKMIMEGTTWYSKYGFKPYDPLTNQPSKSLLKAIKMNDKILQVLETKDINILKITKNMIKKEKNFNFDIDEIKRLIKEDPLFRNFMIRLTKEFEKYCCLIVYIMNIIYEMPGKIKLLDFFGKVFYLNI